jgi:hypothetical protein
MSYGLAAAALFALLAPRAGAIEVLDGRIQAHGFVEMQIRAIDRDFEEELDLVQWYNILNVEIEFDIAPDGFGPIDLLEAFVRIEGRYDCVYQQRGPCNIFPSVNTYGDDAKRLPKRLRDGIDPEYGGSIYLREVNPAFPDKGPASFQELPQFEDWFEENRGADAFLEGRESDSLVGLPGFTAAQLQARLDAGLPPPSELSAYRGGTDDDPARYTFDSILDFKFAIKRMDGPGLGQNFLIGPWLPENYVEELAVLRDLANPLRGRDAPVIGPPEQRTRFFGSFEGGLRGLGDDPDPRLAVNGGYLPLSVLGPLDLPYPLDPAYVNVTEVVQVPDSSGVLYWDIRRVRSIAEEASLQGGAYCTYAPAGDPACGGAGFPGGPRQDWPSAVPAGPFEIFDVYVVETLIDGVSVSKRRQSYYLYLPDPDGPTGPLEGPDTLRVVPGDPTSGWVTNWNGLADPNDPSSPPSDRYITDVSPVVPIYQAGGDVGFGGDFSGNVSYSPASDAPNEYRRETSTELRTGEGPYCAGIGLNDPVRCPNGREPDGRTVTTQGAIDGLSVSRGQRPFSNSLLTGGMGELPLRPAPDRSNRDLSFDPDLQKAQGLYLPSAGLRRALVARNLDSHGTSLSETQRAWNHGQSQDFKELKEAYFDLELLESRLWARLGLQTIIWGKTELFPTTDQFNPVDMALANLPSLEEQRIALWATRFVYSFYDVGPFEDVRVEAALNIDDFQPNDLGACGEPYTLDAACQIPVGLLFHGQLGVGLAGVDRPPDPWKDAEGLEGGVRVEWRWDRFSFAVMDFYGFDDMPYPDPIFFYERNVDLATGRPVVTRFASGSPEPQERGGCVQPTDNVPGGSDTFFDYLVYDDGGLRVPIPGVDAGATTVTLGFDHSLNAGASSPRGIGIDEPCLKAGGEAGYQAENEFGGAQNALYNHYANQQLYAVVCSATVGTSKLQRQACALNLLNSPQKLTGIVEQAMVEFISTLAAGDIASNSFVRAASDRNRRDTDQGATRQGPVSPMRPLNRDRGAVCDPATGAPFATVAECLASLQAGGWDGITTAKDKTFNIPDADAPRVLRADGTSTRNCARSNLDVCRRYSFHYDPGLVYTGLQGDFLTLDSTLSNEQRALLGCGPLFGTRCDSSDAVLLYDSQGAEDPTPLIPAGGGIDLLNADASFVAQSWAGIEGTEVVTQSLRVAFEEAEDGDVDGDGIYEPADGEWIGRVQLEELCKTPAGQTLLTCKFLVVPEDGSELNRFDTPLQPTWLTTATSLLQPQTIRLSDGAMADNAQPCTVFDEASGKVMVLPGCRGIEKIDVLDGDQNGIPDEFGVIFAPGYLPSVDGCVFGGTDGALDIGGIPVTAFDHNGNPVGGSGSQLETELGWCTRQTAAPGDDPAFSDPNGYTFLYGSNSRTWATGTDPNGNAYLTEKEGVIRAGAQPLFHPLAGCLSDREAASVVPSVTGTVDGLGNVIERGNICEFHLRDFDLELSGTDPSGRGPENVFLFKSEGAALSFNAQMFLVWSSCSGDPEEEILASPECFDPFDSFSPQRCSFAAPQFCDNVKGLFGAAGLQRNTVRAGGSNGRGRRTFVWQSGGEAILSYNRRNVLGFSMDFTEDTSKTNWGIEFTWMNEDTVVDNDSPNYIRDVQLYHLTVSIDRPTFINFLNPNRTFFMNTQWFFQYVSGYRDSFNMNGPLNVLATFAVFTGYYQDRLLPKFVAVYDFNSRSGGFLPQVGYRFTEALSAEVGVSLFIGHTQMKDMPIRGLAPVSNRAPPNQYQVGVDNMLSHFRHRDEIWLRLRWTF